MKLFSVREKIYLYKEENIFPSGRRLYFIKEKVYCRRY